MNTRPQVLVVIGLAVLMAGCLEQRARDQVLAPSLAGTVDRVVLLAKESPRADVGECDALAKDVLDRRYTDALARWPRVRTWADEALANSARSEGVREMAREKLTQFDASLRQAAGAP
jgi:hypothetical protein